MVDFFVNKSGNDSNNGLSPATAKLSIGAAIAAAASGDRINVQAGVYSEALIVGGKNLTIIGDPWAKILTPSGAFAGVFQISDAIMVYENLIFEGLNNPEGVRLRTGLAGAGSAMRHCVVTNYQNNLVRDFVLFNPVTIENCIIRKGSVNGFVDLDGPAAAPIIFRATTFVKNATGLFNSHGSGFDIQGVNFVDNTLNIDIPHGLTAIHGLDRNNYFPVANKFQGTTYTTLAAWKAATGRDTNAINTDPQFTKNTDDTFALVPPAGNALLSAGPGGQGIGYQGTTPGSVVGITTANAATTIHSLMNVTQNNVDGRFELTDPNTTGTLLTKVFNFGSVKTIKQINLHTLLEAGFAYPTNVWDTSIADSAPNRLKIEERHSNVAFAETDVAPAFAEVEYQKRDLNISAQYLQLRITFRNNGVAS